MLVLASLVLLGSLGLVACGSGTSASPAEHRDGSTVGRWHRLPPAPIRVDAGLTSVWTGKEMIVSGWKAGPSGTFTDSPAVAAAYSPASHSWRRLEDAPVTDNYCRRAAVWTGKEMLVWGCGQVAFDPATKRWRRLPRALSGQGIVVWTGNEMIGWGGGCCGDAGSDGSAYSPATDTWRTLAPSPLAPEQEPLGVWTGRELLLFVSGINPADDKPWPAGFARAAAYDPANDTWRRLAPPPETGRRFGGSAVWDGHEMLVIGAGAHRRATLAYDPAGNSWRRLASLPSARFDATALWTGKRLLVWGSRADSSATPPAGLAYDPKTNRWSSLRRAPVRGVGQTVVWTGRQLLLWGGVIGTPVGTNTPPRYLNGGAAFTPELERSAR